jgi:hypothetical protein
MRLGSISLITASLLLGAWMTPQTAYAARRTAKNSEGKPTKKGKKSKGSTKPAESADKERKRSQRKRLHKTRQHQR